MTREELIEAIRAEVCRHQCDGEIDEGCKANPNCLCLQDAQAGLRAIEEADCVVVPKEPTTEMLHVTMLSSGQAFGVSMGAKKDIYRWMLMASPFVDKPISLRAIDCTDAHPQNSVECVEPEVAEMRDST